MNRSIICENLGRQYGNNAGVFSALSGINLSIEPGDFISFTGPSGAGKSTLLHILGAIDRPTEGTVFFDGVDINSLNERELAEFRNSGIGFVFQFYHLMPEFSVIENVLLPSMIAGAEPGASRQKARLLLERMGMGSCADKGCLELSGGQMQRVAICRALINNPGVIIADEPTGNLDSEASAAVFEILRELNEKEYITLIIATHDRELAGLADRIGVIRDGKLESLDEKGRVKRDENIFKR